MPDGEFDSIQIGEYSDKSVKVGVGLPLEVKVVLTEFLRNNADLFTVTPHEIPYINPSVACH